MCATVTAKCAIVHRRRSRLTLVDPGHPRRQRIRGAEHARKRGDHGVHLATLRSGPTATAVAGVRCRTAPNPTSQPAPVPAPPPPTGSSLRAPTTTGYHIASLASHDTMPPAPPPCHRRSPDTYHAHDRALRHCATRVYIYARQSSPLMTPFLFTA